MELIAPTTDEEFAAAYGEAYAAGRTIRIEGAASKQTFGGPIRPTDIVLSTSRLQQVRQYEPKDLTISVEAGATWKGLTSALSMQGQLVPFDPPFAEQATIGGIVATATCGPRRRGFGAVRDFVIGMRYVDERGRIVESGAMVAKNAAGYDFARLLTGSYGVLGPILSVNLRVMPELKRTRTWLVPSEDLAKLIEVRDRLIRSFAEPIAIDLLNPRAAARLGYQSYLLAVEFSGGEATLDRIEQEHALPAALDEDSAHQRWQQIREWLPGVRKQIPKAVIVQLSSTNSRIGADLEGSEALARAASGVVYLAFAEAADATEFLEQKSREGRKAIVLSAPAPYRQTKPLWAGQGDDLDVMRKVKSLYDPKNLVNTGRLHGCI
jgi:glycolate oxidase FAD binding subunit